ncbi:MAG: type II secretion system F family protein [Thermoanaerobaculia bacterium]
MLILVVFVLALLAGTMLVYNLLPDFQKINLSKKFEDELGAGRTPPPLVRIFRLPILIFADLASQLKLTKTRQGYQEDVRALGMEKVVSVDQLIALKLTLFFIALFYAIMLLAMLPWIFSVVLAVFGWMYVDLWLKDQITRRKNLIRQKLPFFLDMLTLSVEAGLEFTAAVNKIVTKMDPSPLREEMVIFLRQMQLGMSRKDSLKAMADRLNIQQVNSMVSALIQAAEMGASVGGALRTQSEIMSAERFTDAEKKGAEASQKMLVPMVLFIVPAIMLVILGPLVISFVTGGVG